MDEHKTLEEILNIEDDLEDKDNAVSQELEEEEDILTQHTAVTSPWSRLGIIGVPLGIGFLIFYFLFNNVINGNSQAEKPSTKPPESTEELTSQSDDGDVYAQLALAKQSEQLEKIYQQKEKPEPKPQPSPTTETKPVTTPPQPVQSSAAGAPPPRTYSSPQRAYSAPRIPIPKAPIANTKPVDPAAEFNRLRGIGSYGNIAYGETSDTEAAPDPTELLESAQTPSELIEQPDNADITDIPQESTPNSIEKIRPRWQSQTKTSKFVTLANNYLPQENQILQEKQTRYLTVGEFASGVLVTPVVKQQENTRNERQQTDDGRRSVAQLAEDLRDNYGDVAISSGSLLAVEVISVDGGSYASVQVTSIIKDKTEYPISKGAITVQGSGGKPLIAKKFQDLGGEIAQYDLTVGLVSALGEVGEIINQPNVEEEIEDEFTGRIRRRSSGNRRDLGGALLEGAFGELSRIVSDRAETSTEEILARPNVWYIPKGTKVTFLVNRTLELP